MPADRPDRYIHGDSAGRRSDVGRETSTASCCEPPLRVKVTEIVASLLAGVVFVVVPVAGGSRATTA
jgi:hypothetical protein